ncbi:MAG: hypothetical protein V1728_05695 [Candidatus Micrarchaeota archaeon]
MPKPKTAASAAKTADPARLFEFIRNQKIRSVAEVVASALPGAIVLGSSIFLTGAFNIYKNLGEPHNAFVVIYIPIICLLPVAVGALGPLFLDRIRNAIHTPMKGSVAAATVSGLLGSAAGAAILFVTGLALSDLKPFGVTLDSNLLAQMVFMLSIIVISTALSALGGALMAVILSRSE